MTDGKFKLKLTPQFDGSGSVIELVKKAELACDLSVVKQIDRIIAL